MQETIRGPNGFDGRFRAAFRRALGAGRPGTLPPAPLATHKDAENKKQDQEDNGQQNPGDDPNLLGQSIVHWQYDLVDLQLQAGAGLVENGAAVVVNLRGDAGDLPVVVVQVGFVDGRVSDVCRVGQSARRDPRPLFRVQAGVLGLGPAQRGCGVTSQCRTGDLELRNQDKMMLEIGISFVEAEMGV